MNRLINKILIITGILFILLSIGSGVCIVVSSFIFMGGKLTLGKYILSVLFLGIGGAYIALMGMKCIKMAINEDYEDGQEIDKDKLDASNDIDEPSVKWNKVEDYIEIPNEPINTNISPEEIKDIAALYDVYDTKIFKK